MRHPSEADLTLLAGRELGAWRRWRVARHVEGCAECRRQVQAFAADRTMIRERAAELPPGVSWERLAAEMKANIRVGLAAGECIGEPATMPARLGWRPALVAASATLVVMAGIWLNAPQPKAPPAVRAEGIVLEATPAGIELKQDDRAITMLNPGVEQATVSVNMQGVLQARYVDGETGHVTITNVYAQ